MKTLIRYTSGLNRLVIKRGGSKCGTQVVRNKSKQNPEPRDWQSPTRTQNKKSLDPYKNMNKNMELTQTSWQALKDELVWCLHVTHELF